MRAPLHESRGPLRRLGALLATPLSAPLAALLAAVVLTGLVAVPLGVATAAPASARADDDLSDVDAPVLPPGCFGPGRPGIDPFPCPITPYKANRPTILLWGDSHAYMYIPALKEAVRGKRVNLVSFVAGSCPPVLFQKASGSGKCQRSNFVALQTVKKLKREKADFKVVLGSNWTGFRTAYRKLYLEELGVDSGYTDFTKEMVRLAHDGTPALFERLGKLGVDVDVIAQAAVVPERRPACTEGEDPYQCDIPRWRALPENWRTKLYLREQMSQLRGQKRLVDATPGYCDDVVCHGRVGDVQTFFDDLHLSATRTRNLARYFRPSVQDMLGR